MAEINHQRIKSLYGEIKGILSQLPLSETAYCYPPSIAEHYNNAIDDLSTITATDYSRNRITNNDRWESRREWYDAQIVRTKIGSVISRLEQEYGFEVGDRKQGTPIVVTVNQSQQVSLTVTPITQLIEEQEDADIKRLLEELIDATQRKDESTSKKIIKGLANKSWQVFLQALPYILEQWGKK